MARYPWWAWVSNPVSATYEAFKAVSEQNAASDLRSVNENLYKKIASLDKVGTYQRKDMYGIAINFLNKGATEEEVWQFFEDNNMTINKLGAYKEDTADTVESANSWFKQNYVQNEDGTYSKREVSQYDYQQPLQNMYDMIDADYGKYTDPNSELAKQYKQYQYQAIDEYEAALDQSLAASEMSAYQQIGQQQLELENLISNQRMQALKSGTTSAQLASQQLANLFAAQSGAAQVANNINQNRLQNYNTIAQARMGVTGDMYNYLTANANVGAQMTAAKAQGYSTLIQPYAQYNAYADLYNKNPKVVELMLNKPQ